MRRRAGLGVRHWRGAALVEYILLVSIFSLAAVPAVVNLQQSEKTALGSTTAKIGGSPVPTDVAPTLRSTTTTTTLPPPPTTRFNSAPNVHLPDGIVVARNTFRSFSPDVLFDPEGDPIVTKAWPSINSATWENKVRDQATSNAVLKWTTSGWKTICFSATDSLGATGSDCCDVCVETGVVTATMTATVNYQNATNSTWRLRATVKTTNAGGNVNGPMQIGVRFDFSDGTTANGSCATAVATSSCTVNSAYKPISITSITATVTSVAATATLPCFGGWDAVPASSTLTQSAATPITTTTTLPTTTTTSTTTLPTTTTRPTTTLATTTTTTRATTTTRPTTTTFSS